MLVENSDTTKMCSHLRHKLMDADGIYHPIWQTIQDDPELTAVVRSRQLHIYRNGKKVLILAFADNKGATLKDAIRCWHQLPTRLAVSPPECNSHRGCPL